MGLVIQPQRRAIERVMHREPLHIVGGQRCHLGDTEIYFLGISTGVGTCSAPQFHGIDIAVFGREPGDDRERRYGLPRSCRGAVLLRAPHEGERGIEFYGEIRPNTLAVEALRVARRDATGCYFSSTGMVELYHSLA